MSQSTTRSKIRSQIQPMPKAKTYPTSWAGPQTFRQIYDNLAHYASNVMKSYGFHRTKHIPDALQNGFMVLWEHLAEDNNFLANRSRRQTVFFVLARCKISSLRYYDDKYDSLEELISYDWSNTWDEHTISGLTNATVWWNSVERWATWATALEIRIDVTEILHKVANKYAVSFKHLIALYTVTTQVATKDAAALVGITPWNFFNTYCKPIQQELQFEFAEVFMENHDYTLPDTMPSERLGFRKFPSRYTEWRRKYNAGDTAPAKALLEQYSDTVCLLGALEAQIAGKTYKQAALDMGKNPKSFPKHMKRAARMLAAAYA